MVSDLIAAGCAPDVAAQVVARAFLAGVSSADVRVTSADVTAERRREKDRIRQAERRNRLRTSADCLRTPQMSQNASLYKESKKEEEKEEREAVRGSSRGHRLPDDWVPSPPDQATAETLVGSSRASSELEKFRDHWKQQPGSKGVKLDWDAAWRNWIRRAAEFRPSGGVNGRRKTVHEANDELIARLRALDEPAPGSLCGGESEDVIRLLPARGRE